MGIRMVRRASVASPPVVLPTIVATAIVTAVVVTLSGCAALSSEPVSVALSEQQGFAPDAPIGDPFDDPNWIGQPVGWLAEDRATITIISYGSSGCPYIVTAVEVLDEAQLSIELRHNAGQACSDDLAPRTHVLAVPEGWGAGEGPYSAQIVRRGDVFGPGDLALSTAVLWPVAVTVAGETIAIDTIRGVPDDITLPDGAPDRGEPLAYWGVGRATLRVITWGSSSCPPLVRSAVRAEPMSIDVAFLPSPGEFCTADFSPTTHVLVTPAGIDPTGDVTVTVLLENNKRPDQAFSIAIWD